jgi:hypothetical protein
MTMNRRITRLTRVGVATMIALATGSLAIGSTVSAESEHHSGLSASNRHKLHEVREATEKFTSLSRAAEAGYGQPPAPAPLHECISSFDNTGAMGFHFINGALLDGKISSRHPEVLVYAPDKHGRLHLVALEYVVFQSDWYANHAAGTMPKLFGQMFMATGAPNRYAIPAFFSLHVWLFKHNPSGRFAPFNPRVSCAGAAEQASAASTTGRGIAAIAATADSRRVLCRIPAAIA